MTSSSHISLEKLLLWQDGEFSSEEAEAIRKHIQSCKVCQRELEELEEFNAETEWANARVMQRRLHVRVKENQRSSFVPHLHGILEQIKQHKFWTSVTASGVIAALLIVSIANFTPAARADVFLSRAIRQEEHAEFHAHTLQIRNGDVMCSVSMLSPTVQNLLVSSGTGSCNAISQRLQGIGWGWSSLLSAQKFEQWRSSLSAKHDSIQKLEDVTEVSTSTTDGPIRKAILRIRNSDYHPLEARYTFADDLAGGEVDVRETPAGVNAIETSSKVVPQLRSPEKLHEPSFVQQQDETEAKVRLVLHRVGVDSNILIAVDRQAAGMHVWGVVPTEAEKQSIMQELEGIPTVTSSILTDAEERTSQAPLPWQATHGVGQPLAVEQLDSLFAGNLEDRQAFQNNLDVVTRRLVGAAKARDGLAALSRRQPSAAYVSEVNQAIAELDIQMKADQQLLQQRLQPVIGMPAIRPHALSYVQAMQVYTLVHDVALVSGSKPPTLEHATAELHKILR